MHADSQQARRQNAVFPNVDVPACISAELSMHGCEHMLHKTA